MKNRKHHFSDYMHPRQMSDIPGAAEKDPRRSVVLRGLPFHLRVSAERWDREEG